MFLPIAGSLDLIWIYSHALGVYATMTKLQTFLDGFGAIYNAIYFRFDLQDNIDRCAFFYELNKGWYDTYDPDSLDDRDPWNLSGRDPYYTYMMREKK